MDMEIKSTRWEVKNADSKTGRVEGYASVFGVVDQGGDVIEKGAFAKSIAEYEKRGTMPLMLSQHKSTSPTGEWDVMYEDEYGLFMGGNLWVNDSPSRFSIEQSRQDFNLLASKTGSGFSIGYQIPDGGSKFSDNIRHLTEIKLVETSAVSFPMNELALPTLVKGTDYNVIPTERQLEKVLKDIGLSKAQSRALIAKGYDALRGWDAHEDAKENRRDDDGLCAALKNALSIMKE